MYLCLCMLCQVEIGTGDAWGHGPRLVCVEVTGQLLVHAFLSHSWEFQGLNLPIPKACTVKHLYPLSNTASQEYFQSLPNP